jgi:DNA-binding protein Fis
MQEPNTVSIDLEIEFDDKTAGLYGKVMRAIDADFIGGVLVHTKGNKSKAARILGIDRSTLRSRMKSCGIPDSFARKSQ